MVRAGTQSFLPCHPSFLISSVLYLVLFNLLIFVFMTSFLVTTFRDPGSPLRYRLERAHSSDQLVGWREDSPRANQSSRVYVLPTSECDRFCGICNTPKPERCHHCSVCGKCRLKMDHHCPWFNNCVGYRNYKFFLLSIFYAVILCTFIVATLLQELIWELANGETSGKSILFLITCIFSFILGLSSGVLLAYHTYLLSRNRTTLEQMDRTDARRHPSGPMRLPNPYDLGCYRNWQQVLGRSPFLWPLPIPVDEAQKGLVFPTRHFNRVEPV